MVEKRWAAGGGAIGAALCVLVLSRVPAQDNVGGIRTERDLRSHGCGS
jgi:hypothetical protein